MEVSNFAEKFNKIDGKIYTVEEEVALTNGVYEGMLKHDNINKASLNVYTGSMLTGDIITNKFLSTPSETPWKYRIKVMAPNVDKVYITYETVGDQVEAEDINNIQNELVRTQQEVNIKADKDKVFTKEEVLQKISDLVNSAPSTLNTLNEIATALGNDPNFSATILNILGNKVDKIEDKQLSTEDFSPLEKTKLAGIEENANKYIHPDTHPASIITEDDNHMFITKEEKAAINTSGSDSIFETAGGTGNAITLTLPTLTNGLSKNFIASADNGGTATTINEKNVYKPGTTTPPTFKNGRAYTTWYNASSDCFFIKASAEGNTNASHVLAGDTFSNDTDIRLTGTMSNNGALNTVLPINGSYIIPAGYTTGGIVNQSITTKVAATISPSTAAQVIAANQYLTGAQTINPVTGSANTGHVLSGYTFASANGIGLTGNIPNFYGAWQYASGIAPASGRLHMYPPKGYYDPAGGAGIYYDDANFVAANIVSARSIFGLVGGATIESLGGIRGARSTASTSPFTVSGLSFTPNVVIISHPNTSGAVITLIYVGGSGYLSGSNSWFQMINTATTTNGTGVPSGLTIKSDGFIYNKNASGGTIYWLAFMI